MDSPGGRTSSVTVFIVPPRNITLEVIDQLLRSSEAIHAFLPFEMLVIALSPFVVVTKNAHAIDNVGQPVLEPMC
ncbi:hypothetical protein PROAA_2540004 [Candidatus Propionivibrio aalborgensis]|uniref:Uncharacterized protein n=1 Tax=Candidatus Propionivibrio aalborgensis TaxID=1860101 RepID=A0A1A8XU23_9RHOO|nr:hypothetical protein PROAA_2540004 [Candidatus Propionivibrio aalborgensis]